MKTIYAIRDRIAGDLAGYYPLVVFRTDQQAIRYFGDSLNAEKSALAAHPQDYELIQIGRVEDDGQLHAMPTPTIVITGTALLALMAPPDRSQLELLKEAK